VGSQSYPPPPGLSQRNRSVIVCAGRLVGFGAGLERCEKSRSHRDSIPDRPARSALLYQQRYPGIHTRCM
jgi:hypothetical protein